MTNQNIALAPLSFNGTQIRDRNEMLSLTDMWKAQGADPSRQPSNWLASADARRFIETLSDLNPGISGNDMVRSVRGGRQPGTWANWQVAMAYAKYLSPEFHMWCNTVVRERMEGRPVPTAMTLDAELRQVIGGIVKKVVHAQLFTVMPTLVAGYVAEHSLSLTEGLTAGEVTHLSKVAASYPKGVSQRVSTRLTQFCERNGERPRVTRLGRVRAQLFPTHLARDWLDVEGASLIRRWVDEKRGQGALRLIAHEGAAQ